MVTQVCIRCVQPLQERPIAGRCPPCYWADYNWRRRFDGNREEVIHRDGNQCRACGSTGDLIVHHRRPGFNYPDLLVSLCRPCHAQVHALRSIRRYVPPFVVTLWAEQHPGDWAQQQFDL